MRTSLILCLLFLCSTTVTAEERLKLPQLEAMKERLNKPAPRSEQVMFRIAEARWSQGAIRGLGDFDELLEDQVRLSDMNIYVEIEHLGYREELTQTGPRSVAELEVIGHFFDLNGKPIGHKSLGVTQLNRLKPYSIQAFGVSLALSDQIDPGRYRFDIEVVDKVRQQRAQKTMHFAHHK